MLAPDSQDGRSSAGKWKSFIFWLRNGNVYNDDGIVYTDIDDIDILLEGEKLNLYEHGENVPQVAVFVHRRQVVQDAL